MIKNLGAVIVIGVFCLVSCKKGPMKTYHDNGAVYETIEVINDSIRDGKYTRMDDSGTLIEEATYNKGKLDLTRTIYFPNGNVKIEENYRSGDFHGPYNEYDSTGQLLLTLNYANNVISGTSKGYYPSGSLKEEVTFANNEEEGPFKEYHPNGKISWEGTYRNGDNEFGLLLQYDTTGTLINKMMCDTLGICRTIWNIDKGDIKLEPMQ